VGLLDYVSKWCSRQLWGNKRHSYVDKLAAKKELEKHTAIEKNTIDMAKEEMKHTDDDGIKLLLRAHRRG